MSLTITQAALHALLNDAHTALAEQRVDFAGTVLHVLRRVTAPEPRVFSGTPTADMGLVTPMLPAPTQAAEEAQPAHRHHLPASTAQVDDTLDDPPAARHTYRREQSIRGGAPASAWTRDRLTLLRLAFPTNTDSAALLAELNALPGPRPIASIAAMGQKAIKIGLRRTPEALHAVMRAGHLRGLKAANESRLSTMAAGPAPAEREALLRDLWHQPITMPHIIDRLNEIDGPTITSKGPVYEMAKRLGLRAPRHQVDDAAPRRPHPSRNRRHSPPQVVLDPLAGMLAKAEDAPAPPPAAIRRDPPAAPPPPADPKTEAFDAFDAGQTVRDVSADFGLPLSTLSNWHAEWKLARRKDAAA